MSYDEAAELMRKESAKGLFRSAIDRVARAEAVFPTTALGDLVDFEDTRRKHVADPAAPPPDLQQRYRQFLDLLPLTIALAGLPTSEGRLYSEDQIEGRGITIKIAYRVARNVAKECLGGS